MARDADFRFRMGRHGADLGGRRLHGGGRHQAAPRDARLEPQHDPDAPGAARRKRSSRVRSRRTTVHLPGSGLAPAMRATEGRSFLEKTFGGDVGALLVHFVTESSLDQDQIEQLHQLLAQKKKPRGKRK